MRELDGVAADGDVGLAEAQRLAGRDPDLGRDHVETRVQTSLSPYAPPNPWQLISMK